jgi:uncharacterized integral membrane protein
MEDLEQASTRATDEPVDAGAPEAAGGPDGRALDSGAPADGEASAGRATEAPAKQAKPPRTRLSATFQALLAGAVVLILLLIFILENTESVRINFLGVKGHLSLGVALLLAAAGGALVVAVVGAARISQLRLHERRQRRG